MLYSLFGFLRCGEFTSPSQSAYDPTLHLSFCDLAIDNKHSPSFIRLKIKQSKTDPFRHGNYVHLGKTGGNVCPIDAILLYLAVRGGAPGPLFLSEDHKPLTRGMFSLAVSSLMDELGLQASLYSTHSFCIGAATSAKDAGISDIYVKQLGRWKSDAYQQYIRPLALKLASFSKQIAT